MTDNRPCGVPFLDCQEPSDTIYLGIRCERCGAVMSAEEHERLLEAEAKAKAVTALKTCLRAQPNL